MDSAQAAQNRLAEAFKAADEDLKQRRFKPLQKIAYQCMAKCCDSDGSQKALQDCFAKCGGPLEQATQVYQAETQRFQQKIQRCASSCQDEAQDMMAAMSKKQQEDPASVAKAEAAFGKCIGKCADNHVGQLKGVVKNMDAKLKEFL